jgi:hypothetical protein
MSAEHLTRANPIAEPPGEAVPGAALGRLPHVRDFAELDAESFVEAAYQAVLHRRPDPGGAARYEELLAQGISKAEILSYLVDSPEGRAAGSRVAGLTGACRWARMRRLPILSQSLAIGQRLWPLTGLRRDLRAVTQRLARVTAQVQILQVEAKQRDREALYRLESLRTELMQALATRADSGDLAALRAAQGDLNALVNTLAASLRKLEQSKADQSALDHLQDELRTTLYRGIDDVDRTFRMLLDAKAGTDALTEAGAALDHKLRLMQQELERQVQAVDAQLHAMDARKADVGAIDAARTGMLAALRGIEDVDKTFRALLDGKAGTDALSEVGAALDRKLQLTRQELEQQLQAVDARKADAGAIDAARNEMLAALRTALTGLTGSVSAVAASRVDRATMNALLAENSQALLAQLRNSVQELRSSIEELSAR